MSLTDLKIYQRTNCPILSSTPFRTDRENYCIRDQGTAIRAVLTAL